MATIYEKDRGIVFYINMGMNLAGYTLVEAKIKKQSGATTSWTCTVYDEANGILLYTSSLGANDFDNESGTWQLQSKVTFASGEVKHGDFGSFTVADIMAPSVYVLSPVASIYTEARGIEVKAPFGIDLTTAPSVICNIIKPDLTTTTWTMIVSDILNGIVKYISSTTANEFDGQVGNWQLQGKAIFASGKTIYGSPNAFAVLEVLVPT